MPKLKNIFITFLILGLIYAELLPTVIANKSKAYSPDSITPSTQSEMLLSFFDPETKEPLEVTAKAQDLIFIEQVADIPGNIVEIADSSNIPSLPNQDPLETGVVIYRSIPLQDQPFIGDVIPTSGTALADAYNKGGRAWYQEGEKVVVIFPNSETFRSFNKTTGAEINWLLDRLAYSPIDSPDALENYTKNYHGEIIAETTTWVLVKFPSGGYLKIAKPEPSSAPSGFGPFLSQE